MPTSGEEIAQRILRFSDIAQELCAMLMLISGYEDMPVVPLETAVEPLVSFLPTIGSYAYAAKQRCKKPPADGLTINESAAIMLYSMGWKPPDKCLYVALNAVLRSEDRDKLVPWFLYLKLFLTALSHLSSNHQFVFHGVKLDLHTQYPKDKTLIWWGFSSCTVSLTVLQSELFLGTTGTRTMFAIDCFSGKDIRKHSYYPSEDEILLLAATQFVVRGCLNQGNGLHTIQLQETQPPFPLLQPIVTTSHTENIFSGWNSGNHFACGINEMVVRQTADVIVTTGLAEAGYEYLNTDDCWQVSSDAQGTIQPDPHAFPNGIPALVDYVRSRKLKFGLYSDTGNMTCQRRPGSLGYGIKDAKTYTAWGVDYLKLGSCYTDDSPTDVEYSKNA